MPEHYVKLGFYLAKCLKAGALRIDNKSFPKEKAVNAPEMKEEDWDLMMHRVETAGNAENSAEYRMECKLVRCERWFVNVFLILWCGLFPAWISLLIVPYASNPSPQTRKRLQDAWLACLFTQIFFWPYLLFLILMVFGFLANRLQQRRRKLGQRAVADLSEHIAEEFASVGIEVLTGPVETDSLKLSERESMLFFNFPEPAGSTSSVRPSANENSVHSCRSTSIELASNVLLSNFFVAQVF